MGLFDKFRSRKQEEPVQLPVSMKKAGYFMGTEYAYTGDLIITQEVIYYIPRTDEFQKKVQDKLFLWGGLPSVIAVEAGTEPSSYNVTNPSEGELKEPEISGSSAELQEKLDAYIERLKSERKGRSYSASLPLPMRFARGEIKNLSVSPSVSKTGVLGFDGAYERHLFGVESYKLLRAALVEGGYIS